LGADPSQAPGAIPPCCEAFRGARAAPVRGGPGDDTISARDVIDCGAGLDRVTADLRDRLRRCERVSRRTDLAGAFAARTSIRGAACGEPPPPGGQL